MSHCYHLYMPVSVLKFLVKTEYKANLIDNYSLIKGVNSLKYSRAKTSDEKHKEKTGKILLTSDLALEYGFKDIDGELLHFPKRHTCMQNNTYYFFYYYSVDSVGCY